MFGITGDCPALKKILNFIGHNGYDCCWFCYLHGVHVNGKRQYPYERPIVLRSTENYWRDAIIADRNKVKVNGHLGRSVIDELLDIPLPNSIIIDYLHVSLLGHAKSVVVSIYSDPKPSERSELNYQLRR